MNLDKHKRGFTVTGKHRIETTDFYLTTFWIPSRDSMSDNFLQFFAYDANLYPTPDFSTWKDNKFKQKQIKKALEFTKDFYGEVWLDDVKIKEKSEMENYKQFSKMKQKATLIIDGKEIDVKIDKKKLFEKRYKPMTITEVKG